MCGIVGYIDTTDRLPELKNSLTLMQHRGPDNTGYETHTFDRRHVGLGHLRLSIIDLSAASDQPFRDSTSRYSIVFNGEIYNFRELRKKLTNKTLRTSGDTEVLVELYRQFGKDMVTMLEGMFAFAIYDTVAHTLFIARDHLGIKPVYLYHDQETLIFASEIKGIKAFDDVDCTIDHNSISEYLLNGFLYEPDTGFTHITKLPPGHYCTISVDGSVINVKRKKYWSLGSGEQSQLSAESLKSLIKKEINAHMVSDAKMGLFFSGGVDSSLIMCLSDEDLQPMIVRPDAVEVKEAGLVNDYDYAARIANIRKVDLLEVSMDSDDQPFLDEIEWIAEKVEEPIADYTFLASYKVSKAAKDAKFKVMQSGMGADEVFGGYDRYLMLKYNRLLAFAKWPLLIFGRRFKSVAKKVDRFASFYEESSFGMKYTSLVGYFSRAEVTSLVTDPLHGGIEAYEAKIGKILSGYSPKSALKKGMYLDSLGFLSHNFLVADKSSMLASVEVRVPLATKNLFSAALESEEDLLVRKGTTKHILKKILSQFLPQNIVYRKKRGFNPPLDTRINSLGAIVIKEYLASADIFAILDQVEVERIIDRHFNTRDNYTYKIYNLLFLAAWHKIHRSK